MVKAYITSAVAVAFLLGMATAAVALTGEYGDMCTIGLALGKDIQTKPFQFRRCFLDLYPGERIRYEVVLHDGTIIGYVSSEYGRQWYDTRWFAWNHQGLRAEVKNQPRSRRRSLQNPPAQPSRNCLT